MSDRRQRARSRRLKSGKIVFGKCTLPCVVRNLTDSGALLHVQTTYGIPGKFRFLMDDDAPRTCRTTWVNSNEIGVQFV